MRTFITGATRDNDEHKLDYEGFLSPVTLLVYAQYVHKHRLQSDGNLRASDNWQKGIPQKQYLKSLVRHVMDLWLLFRGYPREVTKEEALCAILFNTFGLLHEILLKREV